MKKLDIIRTYYETNLSKDLPEYGILGWESEEAQRLRFDILLSAVSLEGKALLDVGCGTGNLLEHILSKGINVKYTGVDLLDKMVGIAKRKGLPGESSTWTWATTLIS
jgi:2-polyprenyl-3-methyl-5-hydroxy-6-metoxy-1,4-benzoquinol methylase